MVTEAGSLSPLSSVSDNNKSIDVFLFTGFEYTGLWNAPSFFGTVLGALSFCGRELGSGAVTGSEGLSARIFCGDLTSTLSTGSSVVCSCLNFLTWNDGCTTDCGLDSKSESVKTQR